MLIEIVGEKAGRNNNLLALQACIFFSQHFTESTWFIVPPTQTTPAWSVRSEVNRELYQELKTLHRQRKLRFSRRMIADARYEIMLYKYDPHLLRQYIYDRDPTSRPVFVGDMQSMMVQFSALFGSIREAITDRRPFYEFMGQIN